MLFLREKTANWQTKKIFKINCPQRSICQHEMVTEPQGHREDMITSRKWMALFMNDGENVLMLFKQTVLLASLASYITSCFMLLFEAKLFEGYLKTHDLKKS